MENKTKTVSFGEIQAEILLDFMENNKKAINKHQNRVALMVIQNNLVEFIKNNGGLKA